MVESPPNGKQIINYLRNFEKKLSKDKNELKSVKQKVSELEIQIKLLEQRNMQLNKKLSTLEENIAIQQQNARIIVPEGKLWFPNPN